MTDRLREAETVPCPACPDGNEWDSNGPTGRACKVCGGHAELNRDGSRLYPTPAGVKEAK